MNEPLIRVPARTVGTRPWCDCLPKAFGYTKRDDGVWVKGCCMRREKAAWEKHGDLPTPPIPPSSDSEQTSPQPSGAGRKHQ